jgi:hypothetical protein
MEKEMEKETKTKTFFEWSGVSSLVSSVVITDISILIGEYAYSCIVCNSSDISIACESCDTFYCTMKHFRGSHPIDGENENHQSKKLDLKREFPIVPKSVSHMVTLLVISGRDGIYSGKSEFLKDFLGLEQSLPEYSGVIRYPIYDNLCLVDTPSLHFDESKSTILNYLDHNLVDICIIVESAASGNFNRGSIQQVVNHKNIKGCVFIYSEMELLMNKIHRDVLNLFRNQTRTELEAQVKKTYEIFNNSTCLALAKLAGLKFQNSSQLVFHGSNLSRSNFMQVICHQLYSMLSST